MLKDNTKEEKPIYNNPRINATKYEAIDSEEDNYPDFSYTYQYDGLGRLSNQLSKKRDYPYEYKVGVDKEFKYKPSTSLISQEKYISTTGPTDSPFTTCVEYNLSYETIQNNLYTGNISEIEESGSRFIEIPIQEDKLITKPLVNRKYNYTYDSFNRLIKEEKTEDNVLTETIEYEYSNIGTLDKVKVNGTTTKEFVCDKGRVKTLNSKSNLYDYYGNIVNDTKGTISYNSRNLLSKYIVQKEVENNAYNLKFEHNFYYNYNNARYKKVVKEIINGVLNDSYTVKYHLDGNKILGEDVINSANEIIKTFRYYYDINGIRGLIYKDVVSTKSYHYTYVIDPLGNITKLMYNGLIIGEYVYDAFGNCNINELMEYENDEDKDIDRYVLYHNPFRWKGYYYDVDY